jgi:hypothetical protein
MIALLHKVLTLTKIKCLTYINVKSIIKSIKGCDHRIGGITMIQYKIQYQSNEKTDIMLLLANDTISAINSVINYLRSYGEQLYKIISVEEV